MELQKVNTLSLNNRKTHDRGMFENETEMLKDKLKRTNDRLSQATKAFRSDVERVDEERQNIGHIVRDGAQVCLLRAHEREGRHLVQR